MGVAVAHPSVYRVRAFQAVMLGAWPGPLSQAMWRSGSETKQRLSDKKVTQTYNLGAVLSCPSYKLICRRLNEDLRG